jgi:hypothetical protein
LLVYFVLVFLFVWFFWGGVFETGSHYTQGWPQIHNPPASASQVLELPGCTIMPSFTITFL